MARSEWEGGASLATWGQLISFHVASIPPDLTGQAGSACRDFAMATFKAEWNTYAVLAGKTLPWAAEAYELGLVKLEQGTAPWWECQPVLVCHSSRTW